jgi:hypothetical protein
MPELPPLPYPRIAIEAEEQNGWLVSTTNNQEMAVYAIFISEREQGRIWDCLWYWGDAHDYERPYDDDDKYVPYLAWTIEANPGEKFHVSGAYHGHPGNTDAIEEGPAQTLAKFAIELAQIISADRVPHEPVGFVSRQQKRKWKSKHPYVITSDKPRVYYVNLHAAGERKDHEEGDGSRVYHVRWLVRGHWRHYGGGRTKDGKRTFAKKATWVKAYVKGPVGAPWKGRPVYRERDSRDTDA